MRGPLKNWLSALFYRSTCSSYSLPLCSVRICSLTSDWRTLFCRVCLNQSNYLSEECRSEHSCPYFGGWPLLFCWKQAGVHRFAFRRSPFLSQAACTCCCRSKSCPSCTHWLRSPLKMCLPQESCWERTFFWGGITLVKGERCPLYADISRKKQSTSKPGCLPTTWRAHQWDLKMALRRSLLSPSCLHSHCGYRRGQQRHLRRGLEIG